jgi:hypothetical protein
MVWSTMSVSGSSGGTIFVHYATSPIVGDFVVPWDELTVELRALAGHEERFRDQWRSDRVYVHRLADATTILNIGTSYASAGSFVYEVEPVGLLEADPELGGHLDSSFICLSAKVVRAIQVPDRKLR